jgi:2-polyprenyl-3-methyl-5-hydroxy-6-metoxy-1,4-benzoquinol methylase
MIQHTQCPVCKSTNFVEVMKAKDTTVSTELFGISQCNQCQLRFTNPVPDQTEIGPYYKSEDYVSHTNTSKGFINRVYKRVRKRTLKNKLALVCRVNKKEAGTLLDIGSGAGAFLAVMKEAGWSATGLEPDPEAREVAKRDFHVDAQPIEDLGQLEEGVFDAVTMWHVLEHVHELHAYIAKLKKLIHRNGRIIIAVPNYRSKDAEHYKEKWAAYDVPRHLYHFSPESMKQLVAQYEMQVSEMHRMPYDSFYVSMLSERNYGGGLVKGLWNGFLSYCAAIFDRERCSSIVYIIQK